MEFESIDGAERAMQLLNGAELDGRRLFLRLDRTAVEKEEGYVVFVSMPGYLLRAPLVQLMLIGAPC